VSRNVEIKARITSVEALLPRVQTVRPGPFDIRQDETYFACNTGRLKLRMFSKARGAPLLSPCRPAGAQGSFYLRSPTAAPEVLRESLTLAYGRTGHVEKHRTLFWQKDAHTSRRVSGLGHFSSSRWCSKRTSRSKRASAKQTSFCEARYRALTADRGRYVDLLGTGANMRILVTGSAGHLGEALM